MTDPGSGLLYYMVNYMNNLMSMRPTAPNVESGSHTFVQACLRSCRRLANEVRRIRRSVVQDFTNAPREMRQAVESALNEAEAVAWQTPFPHLFFPVLAEEKVATAERWAGRQQMIRRQTQRIAFAA